MKRTVGGVVGRDHALGRRGLRAARDRSRRVLLARLAVQQFVVIPRVALDASDRVDAAAQLTRLQQSCTVHSKRQPCTEGSPFAVFSFRKMFVNFKPAKFDK